MSLRKYDGQIVCITDDGGKAFTGTAVYCSAEYCLHEYGREEHAVLINGFLLYESQMREIKPLPGFAVLRAAETWQRAGAYYVRIQAMAKKHHIPLRQEFDSHDTPDTKYIVVTDDGFPIATARMYPLDGHSMMIGRVVVLPEYRRQGVASALTNRLARAVFKHGKIPFYAAAWSNVKSVKNGIKSGFTPAWAAMTSIPVKD